jgi:hypothetical protein
MKRFFIFLVIVVVSVGAVFADEGVLIDFTKLVKDIDSEEGTPELNQQTVMDFRNIPGINNYTDDQRRAMKTSLAIKNWQVDLAASSRTVENNRLSYTIEADSKQFEKVLGIRTHFPVESYNSWALVRPPFDIPAFEVSTVDGDGNISADDPDQMAGLSRFEDGYGVLKNVGAIKSFAVDVYGLNFPHALYVLYIDGNGVTQEILMGYLNFDGWAELRWDNPNYVSEVRARTLRIYPLYPTYSPYIKFAGFRIKRDASNAGGDYIGYIKDVKVIYDKAVLDEENRDIDDESQWGIIRDRESDKKRNEFENFGLDQVYRYQEQLKKAPEVDFTPAGTAQ